MEDVVCLVEVSLKPHQGACLYSSDVAKPDESAAQRLFLDSRLTFIACKTIHQHLDNELSIFINAQRKSDILPLFSLPFYVLPYMSLWGLSGNLFLRLYYHAIYLPAVTYSIMYFLLG